jgi:hypothetical protein
MNNKFDWKDYIEVRNTIDRETSLDIFEKLLGKLADWKKVSEKDYKTIEKIYFKLGGK